MNLDGNVIIICFTCLLCVYIIMSKLVEIFTLKGSYKIINQNFNEATKYAEKIMKEGNK